MPKQPIKDDDIVVIDNGITFETQENTLTAKQYAEQAKLEADRAEENANLAENAIDITAGYKDLAKDWAIKTTGKVIEEEAEIDYSSKYYAQQSSNLVTDAQNEADRAESEADRAGGYADSINPIDFAKTDLSNTGLISSAILVNNGIVIQSSGNITILAGTKLLNSNGAIKEFTLPYSVGQPVANQTRVMLWNNSAQVIESITTINYYIDYSSPTVLLNKTSSALWFNTGNKKFYRASATSSTPNWVEAHICLIGIYIANGTSLTNSYIYKSQVLTLSDKLQITDYSFPNKISSLAGIFNKTITTTDQTFTAPVSGWLRVWGGGAVNATIAVENVFGASVGRGAGGSEDILLPLRKGVVVEIKAVSSTTINGSVFIRSDGSLN